MLDFLVGMFSQLAVLQIEKEKQLPLDSCASACNLDAINPCLLIRPKILAVSQDGHRSHHISLSLPHHFISIRPERSRRK